MPLNDSTLSLIAFKQLQGKSMTDTNKSVGNEAEGAKLNTDAGVIFVEAIDNSPAVAVSSGIAEYVTADLTLDGTSNNQAYFATYPIGHPKVGQRIVNAISPTYGTGYEAKPFSGLNPISVNDPIDWVYQYQSGIFYLQDPVELFGTPTSINLYVYTGNLLSDALLTLGTGSGGNIPVYSTGTDNYIGSTFTPYGPVVSYTQDVIYLLTVVNENTGPSTLSIDGLPVLDLVKGDQSLGLVPLEPGDLIASIVYYVLFDGLQFQLLSVSTAVTPDNTTIGVNTAGELYVIDTPQNDEGHKRIIEFGESVVIPTNNQYLIYGDLYVDGVLTSDGQVVILNGSLVLGPNGVFNNTGTLLLVSLETSGIEKYTATIIGNNIVTAFVINHGLNSKDLIISIYNDGDEDVSSNIQTVLTDNNNITLSFNEAPTNLESFKIKILKI